MRKGQEELREVRKFRKNRKSNKYFSCYAKRLSNKYGKNSKNNNLNKILHLEREKVKKGFASKFLLTRSILDISHLDKVLPIYAAWVLLVRRDWLYPIR